MIPLYDDDDTALRRDIGARGVRGTDHGHDTEAHNLRIIQSDPQLQRILRAYRCQDDAGKRLLVMLAERLPTPPVQVPE